MHGADGDMVVSRYAEPEQVFTRQHGEGKLDEVALISVYHPSHGRLPPDFAWEWQSRDIDEVNRTDLRVEGKVRSRVNSYARQFGLMNDGEVVTFTITKDSCTWTLVRRYSCTFLPFFLLPLFEMEMWKDCGCGCLDVDVGSQLGVGEGQTKTKSRLCFCGISGPSGVGEKKKKEKTNISSFLVPFLFPSPPIFIAADFSLHEAFYATCPPRLGLRQSQWASMADYEKIRGTMRKLRNSPQELNIMCLHSWHSRRLK